MTDSEAQQPVDSAQQVTSTTPNPVISQKNPKRVAAGKAIAEKTRPAREAQKKKLAEADMIIAKNQLKKAEAAATADPPAAAPPAADPPAADPPAADPPAADPPAADPPTKNVLTTTQWLSVISIFISVVGIYYKREEIKKVLTKKTSQTPPPSPEPQRKTGIRPMD